MPEQATIELCWICGLLIADSAEHTIKKSDLKSQFGNVAQGAPLYLNSSNFKNKRIQSIDSVYVKASNSICTNCNNFKSQPFDLAWASLSEFLREHSHTVKIGVNLFGIKEFPLRTRIQRRNLHLYFVKLFGVYAKEGNIPLPMKEFGASLRNGKPHPNIYLKFGRSVKTKISRYAARTDVETLFDRNKKLVLASCFYTVGEISVLMMFCAAEYRAKGLKTSWNPKMSIDQLRFYDFEDEAVATK